MIVVLCLSPENIEDFGPFRSELHTFCTFKDAETDVIVLVEFRRGRDYGDRDRRHRHRSRSTSLSSSPSRDRRRSRSRSPSRDRRK